MCIVKLQTVKKALRRKVNVSFPSLLWSAGFSSSNYYHCEVSSVIFHNNKIYRYWYWIKMTRTEPFKTLLRWCDIICTPHTLLFHITLYLEEQTYFTVLNSHTYCLVLMNQNIWNPTGSIWVLSSFFCFYTQCYKENSCTSFWHILIGLSVGKILSHEFAALKGLWICHSVKKLPNVQHPRKLAPNFPF